MLRIKGFDKDLKCRDFQFEIGKEYKIKNDKPLELCSDSVFHYCKNLEQVNDFYSVTDNNRFCEIEVLGEEISDGEKCGSKHIKIVREILGEELQILTGKVNGNTGLWNTGGRNTGDFNTGNFNTGNFNTGDFNTCNWNTGDFNTGNWNTGDFNTGEWNTGNWNTGRWNTGRWNTGNFNTGDFNTGLFNTADYSSGIFCTKSPKICIFNIQTNMTMNKFLESKYYFALVSSPFVLTEWIYYTENEKKDDIEKQSKGGYLKTYTFKEACKNWWNAMTPEHKQIIISIPNFKWSIFTKITGIKKEK